MAVDQIRKAQPVTNTIHNLIQTLNVKLDSAARYGLYEEDARKDGFDDCGQVFSQLAQREQEDIQQLLNCLRQHVGEAQTQGVKPGTSS